MGVLPVHFLNARIALVVGDHAPCEAAAQEFATAGTGGRPIRVFRDEPSGWAWLQQIRR
ncbi:MAG: hypothetical protein OJF58_001539 [Enhydrobacter sp.]|jgi:hypothetical protein|nr:MAG: hypothetical protein OJF58_001539 [Enhydrobacter sp.]